MKLFQKKAQGRAKKALSKYDKLSKKGSAKAMFYPRLPKRTVKRAGKSRRGYGARERGG